MPGEGAPHPHTAQKVFSICCLISYISFLKCYCTDISEASCRTIWYVIYCTEPGQFSDPVILSPPFHMRRRHFARRRGVGICGVTERTQTERQGPKLSGTASSHPSQALRGVLGLHGAVWGHPARLLCPWMLSIPPCLRQQRCGVETPPASHRCPFPCLPQLFQAAPRSPHSPWKRGDALQHVSQHPGREQQLHAGAIPAIVPFSRENVYADLGKCPRMGFRATWAGGRCASPGRGLE